MCLRVACVPFACCMNSAPGGATGGRGRMGRGRGGGVGRGEKCLFCLLFFLSTSIYISFISPLPSLFFFFSGSAGRPSLDDDIWRWSLICDTLGCWFVLTVSLQRRGKNPALHVSKSLGVGPGSAYFLFHLRYGVITERLH